MSDIYLIKKETLNAIADTLRGLVGGDEITPEDMPDKIALAYDTGYDEGYTDALLALPTPLVLQARATPTYSSDFDDYIYVGSTYNNAVGDTTYTMYSFIEYECMDSQSNLVLAVHNKTNRPVTFYFEAAVTDNGQPSSLVYLYKSITVDPNTSSSFEFSYGYQEPEWDYNLIGLRFI